MKNSFDGFEKEDFLKEINRQELEIKKLARQNTLLNKTLEKYKKTTDAMENLSVVVSTEKSKQEKQLQVITEHTPDIFILLDRATNFLLSTQSFLRLSGIAEAGWLHHKPFRQVFASFAEAHWLDHMENRFRQILETGKTQTSEETIDIGAAGHLRHYSVSAVPFSYERGHCDGILVVFNDLTDIIETRDRIAEAHYYKEADRAKTAFLAKMSHEMRTPMNAIIGMSELAVREDIPLAVHEHILTIKQAGTTLLSLINDILDYSKIETGKLEIVPSAYLFSSLIDDVISIIKTKVLESRLRFVVNVDNDIPNELTGDAVRIRQIMMNLLSNAVKYTEKGFVSLSVMKSVLKDNSVVLTIRVEDSGKGIRQEEIGRLFSEFTRVDLVENRGIEGTGLGLAITRSLVEAMKGDVQVQSVYGTGSVFTVTLPQEVRSFRQFAVVERPEDKNVLIYERRDMCIQSIVRTMASLNVPYRLVSSDAEFLSALQSRRYPYVFLASVLYDRLAEKNRDFGRDAKFLLIAEFGETMAGRNISVLTTPIYSLPVANFLNNVSRGLHHRRKNDSVVSFSAPLARILVVDDIETNLQVAKGLLKPYDMQVDVCTSGGAAIEMIKNERYDLVFMDHMMPEMNGMETVARIREGGGGELNGTDLPIIALTANAVAGTQEMFLQNGFDGFLSKPIDIIKMNMFLEKWIPADKQTSLTNDRLHSRREQEAESMRVEGLDVARGLVTVGGSMENYVNILRVFRDDARKRVEDMQKALAVRDLSLYRIYVHAMKSAASNIGATGLSETARVMEEAAEQEQWDFIRDHHDPLLNDVISLVEQIGIITAREERQVGGAAEPVDGTLLQAALAELAAALSNFDAPKIRQAVGELKSFVRMGENGAVLESILHNVAIGEYDEAAALIARLH